MKNKEFFNDVAQIMIPVLTISGQLAVAMKFPFWGLVINLLAQPFWIYSAWKSYKKAKQIGMLVNTVIMSFVIIGGIINYLFL